MFINNVSFQNDSKQDLKKLLLNSIEEDDEANEYVTTGSSVKYIACNQAYLNECTRVEVKADEMDEMMCRPGTKLVHQKLKRTYQDAFNECLESIEMEVHFEVEEGDLPPLNLEDEDLVYPN